MESIYDHAETMKRTPLSKESPQPCHQVLPCRPKTKKKSIISSCPVPHRLLLSLFPICITD